MNSLYELHLRKLENFMERAKLTPQQRADLYSIAESFLADGGCAYASAFAKDGKWPQEIESRLIRAVNEVIEFSRELMNRQDKMFSPTREAESTDSKVPLEGVVSDSAGKVFVSDQQTKSE